MGPLKRIEFCVDLLFAKDCALFSFVLDFFYNIKYFYILVYHLGRDPTLIIQVGSFLLIWASFLDVVLIVQIMVSRVFFVVKLAPRQFFHVSKDLFVSSLRSNSVVYGSLVIHRILHLVEIGMIVFTN